MKLLEENIRKTCYFGTDKDLLKREDTEEFSP